jgi:hypothetical protein
MFQLSALDWDPLSKPPGPARIRVGCGQHSEQSGSATRAAWATAATNPRDSPSPLKPFMQRCVFLEYRLTHRQLPRQRPPTRRNATQTAGLRFTQSFGIEEEHDFLPIGPPWLVTAPSAEWSSIHPRGSARWESRPLIRLVPPEARPSQRSDQSPGVLSTSAKPSPYVIGKVVSRLWLATFFGDRDDTTARHRKVFHQRDARKPYNIWARHRPKCISATAPSL